jgi:hypothetical protein
MVRLIGGTQMPEGSLSGSGRIWLDDVRCVGNESTISDCENIGWGSHNCRHTEDLAITCNISRK